MRRSLALILLCAGAGFGQPSRIVSTAPGVTEILFALGAGDRVVGVSSYCNHPEAARRLPKIGSYSRPDPERIAALQPDLVILHSNRGDVANRLEALRLPVLKVEMNSLAELLEAIVVIGRAAGRESEALRLAGSIRADLDAARRSRPPGRPRALLVVARQPGALAGLIAAGPGTWLHELVEAAGAENVVPSGMSRYPRVSLEMVMAWNPELIFDASSTMAGGGDREDHRRRVLRPWLERRQLAAVRAGRVIVLDDELFVRPGPRIPEALRQLAAAIAGRQP